MTENAIPVAARPWCRPVRSCNQHRKKRFLILRLRSAPREQGPCGSSFDGPHGVRLMREIHKGQPHPQTFHKTASCYRFLHICYIVVNTQRDASLVAATDLAMRHPDPLRVVRCTADCSVDLLIASTGSGWWDDSRRALMNKKTSTGAGWLRRGSEQCHSWIWRSPCRQRILPLH